MEKKGRLLSLDALRGFDMLFISGLAAIIAATAANITGNPETWLAAQMEHVKWIGFHHHDTIFPLFIFLAGAAFPFSFASSTAKGKTKGQILLKAFYRMLILTFLGFVYNGLFRFDFAHQRWASVLARIGMAWFGAAALHVLIKSFKVKLAIAIAILVGYWALLYFVPSPDAVAGTPVFTPEGCIVCWADRMWLPGSFACKGYDPEGLLSIPSSIVLAMFGTFAGSLVRSEKLSGNRKTLIMLGSAALLTIITLLCNPICPIIKHIWSPTFITAAGAYSFAMFAIFYWIIDVRKWQSWTFFFRVVGMNSIAIYFLFCIGISATLGKYFCTGACSLLPAAWSGVAMAFGKMMLVWLILLYMYRKGTFLKV